MPQMFMHHAIDPREEIFNKAGPLDDVQIFNNQVLIGTYIRPNVTKSGIHLADITRDEDIHQGKVGMVLKMGPAAFKDDANYSFGGQQARVGDWVVTWILDGRKININGLVCRVVKDTEIRLTVPTPDMVY